MPEQDSVEFAAAFALGAAIGAVAAVLLRPRPASTTQRLMREIEPYQKAARKRARGARDGIGRGADAAAAAGHDLARSGQDALDAFRDELGGLVEDAKREIGKQVKRAERRVRTLRDG